MLVSDAMTHLAFVQCGQERDSSIVGRFLDNKRNIEKLYFLGLRVLAVMHRVPLLRYNVFFNYLPTVGDSQYHAWRGGQCF